MNHAATASPERFRQQAHPLASSCWSREMLDSFTLQMSAHGFCVSATMMVGDREYAREQLRHAYTLKDQFLKYLAAEMWTIYDHDAYASAKLPLLATH